MSIPEAEPNPSPKRALIQPRGLSPADEHLQRLSHDIDTVMQLQLHHWSDEAWLPVADALAEYGVGVLKGWLYTRQIFDQVARHGFGALRRCPDSWLLDDNGDTIEELAGETVAAALKVFKFKILMKGKWDATKGASLATYFVGQCKLQFANVYDHWYNDRRANRLVLEEDANDWADRDRGTATEVVELITIERLLDRLSTPLAREIFRKKFIDRYTFDEIAATTEGVANGKAAENIVTKEKRRLRDEGAVQGDPADGRSGQ